MSFQLLVIHQSNSDIGEDLLLKQFRKIVANFLARIHKARFLFLAIIWIVRVGIHFVFSINHVSIIICPAMEDFVQVVGLFKDESVPLWQSNDFLDFPVNKEILLLKISLYFQKTYKQIHWITPLNKSSSESLYSPAIFKIRMELSGLSWEYTEFSQIFANLFNLYLFATTSSCSSFSSKSSIVPS